MSKPILLIAEDAEMDRKVVVRFLEDDFEIEIAENGKEALTILTSKHVDIILTDIVMPEMNGLELLQEIRDNVLWNNVGVIVATSYTEKTERTALELGADDIIAKPYDPVVLKRRLANVLAKKTVYEAMKIAEDANRAKTEFLSSMSHDIRTPMNAIIGMTELALDDINNPKQVAESLETIHNSSHHLLQLINDILDMSRIESGRMQVTKTRFSHTKEQENILSRTLALAHNKNLQIHRSVSIKHDICIGDIEKMHRILDNIIGNAIKFTPEGGEISINVDEFPNKNPKLANYRFVIEDCGIGMDKDALEHIFDPFYRSKKVSDQKIEGTGLGMSIVKNSLELIGGTVDVQSEPGKGTRCEVVIPFEISTIDKVIMDDINTKVIYNLDDIRVLLVEDHPVNQKVACKVLEKEGMKVTIANNGKEAVDAVSDLHNKFDIILMDVQMPVMDGYEATRQIRQSSFADIADIPIIAMTANAFGEDIKKSLDAGMNEHISKPIDAKQLYEVIGSNVNAPIMKKVDDKWKQTILIVDDVEVNIAVLETALNSKYRTIHAKDGLEALSKIQENSEIIAVITDIQMPNMNGIELIKKIRSYREYDHIAILANTQYGDVTQEEVLLNVGADDFLYKPTTPTIVTTRLRNVLKKFSY